MANQTVTSATFITPDHLLKHWQGHRRLTRRMIEAFPEDQLFTFSVGGMRPFGELAGEMLGMAAPTVRGIVSGEWGEYAPPACRTKSELLQAWDEATAEIDALWPKIPAERFQEHVVAFGQFPGLVNDLLLYVIDNEVHHRGQAYAYLRALGGTPAPFYERD